MAIAGDGIRVWVDGDQLIVNQWQGQAATPAYRGHTLCYGKPTVQVAYFDAAADAMANVPWAAKPVARSAT